MHCQEDCVLHLDVLTALSFLENTDNASLIAVHDSILMQQTI